MLIGCMPAGGEILCAREGADRPRRLVAIDARSGAERVIFDPNPQLLGKTFGHVQRLRYTDPNGLEGLADLVLPPDHRRGEKHPLVVVQYRSDGFLRGGTGDEVPIHVLANRGFAVLSFARPYPPQPAAKSRTDDELVRTSRVDWLSRRVVQVSLEAAVGLAIRSGAVDADRMGISGFSDGVSTVQWALINSSLFKVATLGTCCEDLFSFAYSAGPRFGRLIRTPGYRFFETGSEDDWKPMSLVLNVDRVHTPILIQAPDSEYQSGLDVVTTYKLRERPIELFVLNDETHVKWQPAHRHAMYRRTVDWFEFWLMRRIDCDPGKADQYRRWKAMTGAPAPDTLACSPPGQVQDRAQFSASARSSRR
jgi:dipeptidyl aminopeptidase/acylaminoacyl peptidase